MARSKQAATPSEGIYYVIPKKDGHVTIISQRADETNDEPAHMFFWERVLHSVAREYGLDSGDVMELQTHYMALPRGRVQKEIDKKTFKYTGGYVILHGGDVPISAISYAVLQDFGLVTLSTQKKVTWQLEEHEKMDPDDAFVLKQVLERKEKMKAKAPAKPALKKSPKV